MDAARCLCTWPDTFMYRKSPSGNNANCCCLIEEMNRFFWISDLLAQGIAVLRVVLLGIDNYLRCQSMSFEGSNNYYDWQPTKKKKIWIIELVAALYFSISRYVIIIVLVYRLDVWEINPKHIQWLSVLNDLSASSFVSICLCAYIYTFLSKVSIVTSQP